ncbi:MAG: hypothetical protein GY854_10950 [Deltaproteobacteria bacterium]|nr:hypothetical protein [Deltaproteobacteria bacterium]
MKNEEPAPRTGHPERNVSLMKTTDILTLGAVILLLALIGCSSKKEERAPRANAPAKKARAAKPSPAADKARPHGPKPAKLKRMQLSASHIWIMHNGSTRKPPEIKRTKEEALARANEALEKLKAGADFVEMVKEYSDDPKKENGGNLGVFPSRMMAPVFSKATMALEIGQISEPVETQFGYHIIKRQKVEEILTKHILVMHNESKKKPPAIKRTKEEAKKLIDEIAEKLKKPDADFGALAKEFSDCPSKKRGGQLPKFAKGKMAPKFEVAALALKENEISGVVETIFGYHIIQRLPLK